MTPLSFSRREIDTCINAVIVEEQDIDQTGEGVLVLFVVSCGRIVDDRRLTDKNRIIETIQRVYAKYPSAEWLTRLSDERIRHLAYDHAVLQSNTIRKLTVLV